MRSKPTVETYVNRITKVIEEVRSDANQSHQGSEMDLCNILLKVIKEFKNKGRDFVVDRYWVPNPDQQIANWRE